MSMLTWHV